MSVRYQLDISQSSNHQYSHTQIYSSHYSTQYITSKVTSKISVDNIAITRDIIGDNTGEKRYIKTQ